jgi:regulator of replication initiation timing
MTFMGKILVLINLAMSFLFMAFAVIVYTTRVELNTQLASAKTASAKVASENASLKAEKDDLSKKMADQVAESKREADRLNGVIKNQKSTIDNKDAELRRARVESSASSAEMNNATVEQKQRRQEVEELRKTRDNLLGKNADLITRNTSLQDKLSQTTNDLQLATTRNEQMAERLRQLEGYIVRVKGTMPDEQQLASDQAVPPPPNVEGIIQTVDRTGKFVKLSIGEDDGLRKGQVLEVWRTKPEPKYVGQVRITLTEHTMAVAQPLKLASQIREGDMVGPRVPLGSN